MQAPYFDDESVGGDVPGDDFNATNQSTEKSIKSCYAVVYELQQRKWVVSGEGGWSEVHLCQDYTDDTHRILAWTVKSQQVLMNCNVTSDCVYKAKSANFHSFTDENGNRFGLGFHKSESGLKQASHFLKAVISVIQQCQQNLPNDDPYKEHYNTQSHATNNGYNGSTKSPKNSALKMTPKTQPLPPLPSNSDKVSNFSINGNGNTNTKMYNNHSHGNNVMHMASIHANHHNSHGITNKQKSYSDATQPPHNSITHFNPQQSQHAASPLLHKTQSQFQFNDKQTSNTDSSLGSPRGGGGHSNMAHFQPTYHLKSEQHKSIPKQPVGPLGNLKILPPKSQKHYSGDNRIKNPSSVEHKMRVTHDKETGLYSGLPKEWMEELNKQFGVNPKLLPGVKMNAYASKIPKVLVTLRKALEDANGYAQVGIFRLAPNASDSKAMKEKIDKGHLNKNEEEKIDVNVYANLIKVWFRDLPEPLLNCANPDQIEHVNNQNDAVNVVQVLPEPNKSIFLWLCDMCVEIAKFESVNKMGAQNMAIVVGPNLFNTDQFENPMKAMTYSGKVVEFFKQAILWRAAME